MKRTTRRSGHKSHGRRSAQKAKLFPLVLFAFFAFFVVANITASQYINPLFFRLVNDERSAAVLFLQDIRHSPWFPSFMTINKVIFGATLERDVNRESIDTQKQIAIYERLLADNPKNRDLLYTLSLLYLRENNTTKSDEYMIKAREIDPTVGL